MSRIFISYKRLDKDKVFKIKDQIESTLGEKCWIDLDGIESDAQFMNVIIKAIRECEVLLFMYSKTHAQITDFEKDWTVRELNFASKKEKRIVFVNIDGSPLSDEFEFMYGTKQHVDATSANAINRLCADLRTWLTIPSISSKASESIVSPPLTKKNQDNYKTFKAGNVEFKMIHVEGGTFTMGKGRVAHKVTLSPYYIGETPVTQALWKEVTGNNPSYFKYNSFKEPDQCPVESVSWNDSLEFIKNLNLKTGKQFRLITEAEWEFAARGGTKSKGYEYSGSDNINEVAWYIGCGLHTTFPVKNKRPNELGIYDMSGNVGEWCYDWYDDYSICAQTNPTGPNSGTYHVIRGGSYFHESKYCRTLSRGYLLPTESGAL